jgi:hypothetical protein
MPQTFNVGSRSLFVTLVAWLFVAVAAMASASALLHGAGVALGADEALSLPQAPGALLSAFVSGHIGWVMGAGLLLAVATIVAGIGLMMRLEWARRTFIGLLVVAVLFNLAGLWLQHELVQGMLYSSLSGVKLPAAAQDLFGGFVTASRVMAAVVTLGLCALLLWIMRRLMSPSVRSEFG